MNRRNFLGFLASLVPAGLLASWLPAHSSEWKKVANKTLFFGATGPNVNPFKVLPDGTLSLDGQTSFPVYGATGGILTKRVSYKLIGDFVWANETTLSCKVAEL